MLAGARSLSSIPPGLIWQTCTHVSFPKVNLLEWFARRRAPIAGEVRSGFKSHNCHLYLNCTAPKQQSERRIMDRVKIT